LICWLLMNFFDICMNINNTFLLPEWMQMLIFKGDRLQFYSESNSSWISCTTRWTQSMSSLSRALATSVRHLLSLSMFGTFSNWDSCNRAKQLSSSAMVGSRPLCTRETRRHWTLSQDLGVSLLHHG